MTPAKPSATPRDDRGRFLPIFCDDPNCDGSLELDKEFGSWSWICNGLTHDTDEGPLRACNRSYPARRPT
jgi:hypothetical protein